MADTVTTFTVYPEPKVGTSVLGSKKQVMKFTNSSDGTGESNVVKVDISTLVGPNGITPTKLAIDKVEYSTFGMAVKISFDRTTDLVLGIYQGFGCQDFTSVGGFVDIATGDTGDLLFTTIGHSSGDTYDITIHFRKKS